MVVNLQRRQGFQSEAVFPAQILIAHPQALLEPEAALPILLPGLKDLPVGGSAPLQLRSGGELPQHLLEVLRRLGLGAGSPDVGGKDTEN